MSGPEDEMQSSEEAERRARFVDTDTERYHFDEATKEAAKEFDSMDAIERYLRELAEKEEQGEADAGG